MGILWEFSLVWWPPIRYPECMGKNIRHTLTLTITETWIIAWVTDDALQPQATTIVQDQPKPQEEEDETILSAVTTAATTDAQPNDAPPKSSADNRRKRTRRRRSEGK